MGYGVLFGLKSYKAAYNFIDICQMKPDIEHLHTTTMIMQISENILISLNIHIMLCNWLVKATIAV